MIECNDPGLGYLRALGREERHLVPELGQPPRKPNDHTLGPPVSTHWEKAMKVEGDMHGVQCTGCRWRPPSPG